MSQSPTCVCPAEAELLDFLSGRLDGSHREAELSAHVDSCEACLSVIERRSGIDSFEIVRHVAQQVARPPEEIAADTASYGLTPDDTALLQRLRSVPSRVPRDSRTPNVVAGKKDWSGAETAAVGSNRASNKSASDQHASGQPGAGRGTEDTELDFPQRIDHYEVAMVLGRGGMGNVYLARDTRLNRPVAIKVATADVSDKGSEKDRQILKRFQQEMEAVGQLDDPHIVRVAAAGETEAGHPYLVMEYLRGCDLAQYVREHGPIPPQEACRMICDAARGLQHAHDCRLIHRDIKPSNLFRTQSGVVKVLDFGMAQLSRSDVSSGDTLTTDGLVLGTVEFMAPEQALNSRKADHRADIYGLGCTLAWLITGRHLHSGSNAVQIIVAHRDAPVPNLTDRCPQAGPVLNRVFQRMVARRPEDRFQSMAEVVAALEPFTHESGKLPDTVVLPARGAGSEQGGGGAVQRRSLAKWFGWGLGLCAIIVIAIKVGDRVNQFKIDTETNAVTPMAGDSGADSTDISVAVATPGSPENSGSTPDGSSGGNEAIARPKRSGQAIAGSMKSRVAEPAATITIVPGITERAPQGRIGQMRFLPDSQRLVLTTTSSLQVWDLSDPAAPRREREIEVSKSRANGIALLADGQCAVTSDDGSVRVVDLQTGDVLHQYQQKQFSHGRVVPVADASVDGSRLVFGTMGAFGAQVIAWSTSGKPDLEAVTFTSTECYSLAVAHNHRLIAAGLTNDGLHLIDYPGLDVRHKVPFSGQVHLLRFSADDNRVYVGGSGDSLLAVDTQTGEVAWHVPDHTAVSDGVLTPDGQHLIYSVAPNRLTSINLNDQTMGPQVTHASAIESLAISADGTWLAATSGFLSGKGTGVVNLWKTSELVGDRSK